MSDVQNVRMFLGYGLVFFTINVLQMVAVTVLLFWFNWQLALLTLLFFPFLLLVTVRFGKRLQPVLKDVQQKIADVTTTAEENVTGSRIVRIFAREDDELEKFTERSTAVFEASVAAARLRAIYIPLIGFLPNLAVLALLWYGGRQVIEGDLTLGELVAFYSYVMLLVYPAQVVGWLAGLMQRAIASGDRVFEILDAPLEMTERDDAVALGAPGEERAADGGRAGGGRERGDIRGGVRFDHVSFSYVDHMVLDDVSLDVPPGRTVALVGHTGSGKSTLAALVPRFYDASGGTRVRRRRRRPRREARRPAPPHRHRRPGPVPVLDDDRARTSASGGPRRATRRFAPPPDAPRPTRSSRRCPTATRRSSASAG